MISVNKSILYIFLALTNGGATNQSIVSANDSKKILHFPIIPHHEVIRRHRRLAMQEKNNNQSHRRTSRNEDTEELETEREFEPEEDYYDYQHNATLEVGGLYQGYGTHYVDLWVGTPPQRQTVIVDTGSGVTAFPCSGCQDCGSKYHVDSFFQEPKSSTFEKFTCNQCIGASCRSGGGFNSALKGGGEYCHLSVSYQEGSMWNAYEGRDVTYVGGLHGDSVEKHNKQDGIEIGGSIHGEDPLNAADYEFNMVFGCQTKITGLFKTQLADGIMGMCLKPSSIFNQMYQQNIISSPSFSLCFTRAEEAEKEGTIAGALTMGGTDTRLHLDPMVYAHGFNTKGVMHGVNIRKVYIMEAGQYRASQATPKNTKQVQISTNSLNSGSIIVDSGTTDTYMTRNLKTPFEKLFKQVAGYAYNENGMNLSDEQISHLPTIILQLNGRVEENEKLGKNTLGLAGALDSENPYDILIAIPPAHYVEYDTDHKKYVGRFSLTENSGSVLGANTMRGHDVFFNIPESSTIGFAPSECDYFHLIDGTDDTEDVETNERKVGSGDDYYAEDTEKFNGDGESQFDIDDDIVLLPTKTKVIFGYEIESPLFVGLASIAIVGLVSYMLIAIVKHFRSEPALSSTSLERDELNDLHLDTEIERLPAIA